MKRSKELEKERSTTNTFSFHLLSLGPLSFMFQLLLLSSVHVSSDLIFILSNSTIVVCIPKEQNVLRFLLSLRTLSFSPVVVNQKAFGSFLVVTTRGCYWHLVSGGQG